MAIPKLALVGGGLLLALAFYSKLQPKEEEIGGMGAGSSGLIDTATSENDPLALLSLPSPNFPAGTQGSMNQASIDPKPVESKKEAQIEVLTGYPGSTPTVGVPSDYTAITNATGAVIGFTSPSGVQTQTYGLTVRYGTSGNMADISTSGQVVGVESPNYKGGMSLAIQPTSLSQTLQGNITPAQGTGASKKEATAPTPAQGSGSTSTSTNAVSQVGSVASAILSAFAKKEEPTSKKSYLVTSTVSKYLR